MSRYRNGRIDSRGSNGFQSQKVRWELISDKACGIWGQVWRELIVRWFAYLKQNFTTVHVSHFESCELYVVDVGLWCTQVGYGAGKKCEINMIIKISIS